MDKKINAAKQRIKKIKETLLEIGPMMPGKLSQQQRKDKKNQAYGSYWKLGYTYKMASRSHYIPDALVKTIQEQNKEFKRFKKLTEEWVDLALLVAKKELDNAKESIKN